MQQVVLINDFRGDSLYKSIVEGMILSLKPDINITHIDSVFYHSIFEAALILRFAVLNFSENTIYIVGVSSVCTEGDGYLYVLVNNRHLFLPNNGILGLFKDLLKECKIYLLPYETTTFPEIDVFLPAIKQLIENGHLNEYESLPLSKLKTLTNVIPHFQENSITCSIIYIDSYGNVITNLSREEFENHTRNRRFVIYPGTRFVKIYKISETYLEPDNQEVFAVFNALGLLELGIKNGSLSSSYSLSFLSNITIEIYDT